MRRSLSIAAVCLLLAGCGVPGLSSGKHVLRHAHSHHRLFQGALCGYHAYRLFEDIRHHKIGWGALQGYLTVHHCRKVL